MRLPSVGESSREKRTSQRRWAKWWRRAVGWLWASEERPLDPDEPVELTRMARRADADLLAIRLKDGGVQAGILGADTTPHLGVVDGYRVMVRARDAAHAGALLEEFQRAGRGED